MTNGLMMKYFVLKPAGNDHHAAASRSAMRRYADCIELENPQMAVDLRAWADQESAEAYARSVAIDDEKS